MAEYSLLFDEEIASLPRWAIVAFAARCALRVFPIVEASQRVPDELKAVARKVILFAFDAAAAASASSAIASAAANDAADAANTIAANAADARATNAYAAAAHSAAATYAVCAAAETAPASADSDSPASAYAAAYVSVARATAAATAATAAATSDAASKERIKSLIRSDLDALVALARAQKWSNDTPVPRSVFPELWPDGAPDWTKAPDETHSVEATYIFDAEPSFDIWIDPGNASVEDIQAVFQALSDLNRAHGGAGLTFDSPSTKNRVLAGG